MWEASASAVSLIEVRCGTCPPKARYRVVTFSIGTVGGVGECGEVT
jgi:hypothetical protein